MIDVMAEMYCRFLRTQHKAEALEDTLDVDIFSPPRQDWLIRRMIICRKARNDRFSPN